MEERQSFKDHVPFESKRLEEDKADDKSLVMSIRINEQERLMIEQARKLLNVESDTKALKMIAEIGLNVIQATFGEKMLRYLSDSKRERKTDYERGYKRKNDVL
jgi:hypothetical protein